MKDNPGRFSENPVWQLKLPGQNEVLAFEQYFSKYGYKIDTQPLSGGLVMTATCSDENRVEYLSRPDRRFKPNYIRVFVTPAENGLFVKLHYGYLRWLSVDLSMLAEPLVRLMETGYDKYIIEPPYNWNASRQEFLLEQKCSEADKIIRLVNNTGAQLPIIENWAISSGLIRVAGSTQEHILYQKRYVTGRLFVDSKCCICIVV